MTSWARSKWWRIVPQIGTAVFENSYYLAAGWPFGLVTPYWPPVQHYVLYVPKCLFIVCTCVCVCGELHVHIEVGRQLAGAGSPPPHVDSRLSGLVALAKPPRLNTNVYSIDAIILEHLSFSVSSSEFIEKRNYCAPNIVHRANNGARLHYEGWKYFLSVKTDMTQKLKNMCSPPIVS